MLTPESRCLIGSDRRSSDTWNVPNCLRFKKITKVFSGFYLKIVCSIRMTQPVSFDYKGYFYLILVGEIDRGLT